MADFWTEEGGDKLGNLCKHQPVCMTSVLQSGHLKTTQHAPTEVFAFSCFSRSSLLCLDSLEFLQLLHQLGFLVRSHASKHRCPQQDLQ